MGMLEQPIITNVIANSINLNEGLSIKGIVSNLNNYQTLVCRRSFFRDVNSVSARRTLSLMN